MIVIYSNNDVMKRMKPCFKGEWQFIHSDNVDINSDDLLKEDVIVSLHCKKIFPKKLTEAVKCINVHPGYNPYNRGMFPHVFSIINGLPAGVTIHQIDENIDTGPIFVREQVPVLETDTSETLYERILKTEEELLAKNLQMIVNGEIVAFYPEEASNYNSFKDYKSLCELDQEQTGTFGEFYNILRALSHGEYKNAKLKNIPIKLTIL